VHTKITFSLAIVNNPPKILHDEYIIFTNQFQVLYDFIRWKTR